MLVLKENFLSEPSEIRKSLEKLLESFSLYLEKEGVRVTPYREQSLNDFDGLPSSLKIQKAENFFKYYELCRAAIESGVELRNNKSFLNFSLKKLNLWMDSEAIDRIDRDDIIEVYSLEKTQLYRNLKFLEICSYPMLDLYMYEWPELFCRPDSITEKLIQVCGEVIADPLCRFRPSGVPEHVLEETFSQEKLSFMVDQKVIAPVKDAQGRVQGVMGSLQARVIDRTIRPLSQFSN